MLAIKALNQSYGGSRALWDVDLTVPEGSRTCLLGRNGMGKTTLLKCIMGLLPALSGEIMFRGTNLLGLVAEERARLGIGYVPQGREIFSQLTVEENLSVGLGIRKNGTRTIPPRIFELFPVLKQMLARKGGDLSGGQQQQLAIGRALVLEPTLLILDEPTEGIQPNIVHEIGDIVLRLNREEGLNATTPTSPYCHTETAYITQVRALGTYTVPRAEVQLSAGIQSNPGQVIQANFPATNAFTQPSLGRPLAGNASTATINLVEPGQLYGERQNQVDLRIGKVFHFAGRGKASVNADIFNAFNASAVIVQNDSFSTSNPALWQTPQVVLNGRMMKLSVQFDF